MTAEIIRPDFNEARKNSNVLWRIDDVYHHDIQYSFLKLSQVGDPSRRICIACPPSAIECAMERGDKLEFNCARDEKKFHAKYVDMGDNQGMALVAADIKIWKPNAVYGQGWKKIRRPLPQTAFKQRVY